jgi:ABC-2 type transport system permease protein
MDLVETTGQARHLTGHWRDAFLPACRAELLKLVSIRTTWILLVGPLVVVGLVSTLAVTVGTVLPVLGVQQVLLEHAALSGAANGAYFALLVGIVGAGSEWRHRTISSTFLAVPRREVVLLAKLVASLALGIGYGLFSSLLAAAIVLPWLGASSRLTLPAGDVVLTLAGAVAGSALLAALGAGLATALRGQVLAIVIVLVWFFIVEGIIALAVTGSGPWMPGGALQALADGRGGDVAASALVSVLPQPMWEGALVLMGYVAGAAAAGWASLRWRDVPGGGPGG